MSIWAYSLVAACLLLGLLLRLRFGNLYKAGLAAFEARTGITARQALMAVGGATLVVWAVVALSIDHESRQGLEDLLRKFQRSPAAGSSPSSGDRP